MKTQAFTLIELLVVIAIISLLVSILLPSLQKARSLAQMVACLSNCRSIGSAFAIYLADNDATFPGWWPSGSTVWAPAWNIVFVRNGSVPNYDFFDCPTEMGTNITEISEEEGVGITPGFNDKIRHSEYGYNHMSLGMKNRWLFGLVQHDPTSAKESDLTNPAETICVLDSAFVLAGDKFGRRGYYVVDPWFNWGTLTGMPAARHNQSVNIQWTDGHCETTDPIPALPEDPAAYDSGINPYYFAPFSKGSWGPYLPDNYWSRY